VLHVRNSDGTERMLLDVTALDPGGLTTLDGWTPSREGDRLAYPLSTGGDEESRLYVMDVTSGQTLEGPMAGEQLLHPEESDSVLDGVRWLDGADAGRVGAPAAHDHAAGGPTGLHRAGHRTRPDTLTSLTP
jgi:prolyl oligopeptidase PreP (S9A serine peptidase family)